MGTASLEALLHHYLGDTYVAPACERLPLEIDQCVVGSVTPADAQLITRAVPGVELDDDSVQILPVCAPDAPAALQAIALALRQAGRLNGWRDELLPVCADDGSLVGGIERACVRLLGIRTFAVHMVGQCHPDDCAAPGDYTVWLQRRAPDKAVDPGMLDTLAGGLISLQSDGTMEPLHLGMQREVAEEAGLEPTDYDKPHRVDTWRLSTPVREGYMIEDCTVWRAQLARGARPENRDGEVSEFIRVGRDELLRRIDDAELTFTASAAALLALRSQELPG